MTVVVPMYVAASTLLGAASANDSFNYRKDSERDSKGNREEFPPLGEVARKQDGRARPTLVFP